MFADTWGPSYGSIQHLVEYYGDPDSHQSNYGSTSLTLEVQQAHPILQGLAPGNRLPFASSANASWFNGYSGIHLGDIESGLIGTAGTGVAYKPVSEESAHVLLSTFTAASWNQPQQHWLHGQHEVLLATLDYLLDEETRFGELRVTIVDTNGDPLQARTTVRETGLQTTADRDGEAVLHHEEGEFTVEVRHSGYEIETVDVDFVYGEAGVIEVEMGESDGSQISGDVVNAQTNTPLEGAKLQLRDEGGEVIQETTSDGEGSYVFTELTEGEYQLTSQLESFVHFETTVTVASSSVEQQIFMEPVPNVAIIGDRAIGNDHLQAIFEEVNIEAERYSSTADIVETVGDYDVVWFNNETNVSASDFAAFEEAAIARETSVVYGDTYFSGGGISHLHNHRDHPGERTRVDHRQTAAEYVVEDEHPIFANETGNIGLLTPTASRVTAFNEYDGFSLAQVAHVGEAPHGTGVAFTPTSPESVELLMSAHAVEIAKSGDDYTASGKDMFIDATLWAAYEQFYEVAGTVTNENGEAIRADVTVSIDDATLADRTAEDDASFTIPSIAGEANVRVEAFGYATEEIEVSINEDLEMLDIVLPAAEDAGSIQGSVNQLFEYGAIADVEVSLQPTERTTATNADGSFRFDAVEPGSYTVSLYKEGLLRQEVDVDVAPNENIQLEIGMRSSPTVGIIVDRSSGTGANLSSYLQYQGYVTEDFLYTDTEMIEEVDLVFANSDFNNQLIPSEEEFIRFTEALDATRTPVIWTGQHGGRGSIRYLVDYMNDPEIEYRGNVAGENAALVTATDHPIFANVDETFTFTNQSNYYYGFDGYSGHILAEQTKEGVDNIGSMVGMKGRTAESIEILLAGMTINTHFYPGHENYDDNRAQIIDNAILYAIDTEESYAGEIHGTLMNNFGTPVQGTIHIEETGDEVETRANGEFFIALPEGTYTLHLSAFGHRDVTYEQSIENGNVIEQVFEMEVDQSGQLIGEILGAGEPLEGVVVDVINSGVTTSTGEDGTFAVTLPEGNYDIRFYKEGFQPVTEQVTITEGEETSVQINLIGQMMLRCLPLL
ncbi:carboxypeptidase regulatory-like domain-containing protein [Geomicrobium sp. JCM 19039]|uniref:carboxypeptidase regulatory-like domain-containing protein n=1 Tax=Geomicrobium sp. JCM 19039 TaxID=1460636 RepID=UPI00045F1937|nr:carboxypeptidase regulatory-like domain-containing protein [Geomicrobium sp. JCM 19039]GAK10832.1 hypothetical protein JCM19039_474 [Geomicrobium sp. JCM 19039]